MWGSGDGGLAWGFEVGVRGFLGLEVEAEWVVLVDAKEDLGFGC